VVLVFVACGGGGSPPAASDGGKDKSNNKGDSGNAHPVALGEPTVSGKSDYRADLVITRGTKQDRAVVYVNGSEVGQIRSGSEKGVMRFNARENGKNTVKIKQYYGILDPLESPEVSFVAGGGATVEVIEKFTFVQETIIGPIGHNPVLEIAVINSGVYKDERVRSIKLDTVMKLEIVKRSPSIELAPGTEKTIEDTVRVAHVVSVSDAWKTEGNIRSKVKVKWIEVESGVRNEIGRTVSKSYGIETERKRSETIKGERAGRKINVIWVEYYRTGIVTLNLDGTDVEVPFKFREDFDLLTELAQ
jgi:hypothetical protein